MKPRIVAIIPARYASSRFPGKMLATIMGKSLLQHTYECVKACRLLDDVLIATDDERIQQHATNFAAKAIMTDINHPTGSDRIIEVLKKHPSLTDAEIILNVQGDEPCIPVQSIEAVCNALVDNPEDVMATAVVKITDPDEIQSPAVVKCVVDARGYALYFSRVAIPGVKPKGIHPPFYYKHLGIYAYRREFLLHYGDLVQTPLQLVEDLEQLKVLEAGYKIKIAYIERSTPAVDLPEDIQRVTEWLCTQNLYS